MTIWWLAILVGSLLLVAGGITWTVLYLRNLHKAVLAEKKSTDDLNRAYTDIAEEDASHLFNTEFREELRNRGRLRFEQIIDQNANFLKQDLDTTTQLLNEYMHKQITAKLDEEFANYAKAMQQAQTMALGSLQKTAQDIETQRLQLAEALKKEVAERELALLKVYEDNMAKIVEHYVLQSLGDQFDLKAQLPFIIKQMEANKKAIMEDMRL